MNRQAIQNYTQKLNILVSSQSSISLRDGSKSTERFRVQTSGHNLSNKQRSDYDDINQSTQSYKQSDQKEIGQNLQQKHRMIIESPNSRSVHSKENNFYLKSHLKDSKTNQGINKGSLTSDISKSSQNVIFNQTMSSINAASTKYEKPIKRIFQQLSGSQLSNYNSTQRSQIHDDTLQKNSINLTNEVNNTREENLLKTQQLIQNKYSYILQNSQLFKRQSQIKQNLPVKLQNIYDINLIDLEDVKNQYPVKEGDLDVSFNHSIQNNIHTVNNFQSNHNISNDISPTTPFNNFASNLNKKNNNQAIQIKSLFQRQQNQQIQEVDNAKKSQQNQVGQSQNIVKETLQNKQQNEINVIKSEDSLNSQTQSNIEFKKGNNQVLQHQLSLRSITDNLSPTRKSGDKRRFTQQPRPNIKISDQDNDKSPQFLSEQQGSFFGFQEEQNQKLDQIFCSNCQSQIQNQQSQQSTNRQLFSIHSDKDTLSSGNRQSIKKQELEFCLLDIIEKLDKNIMQEIEDKQFQKKYLNKILEIINEHMPSVLIRVNELLGDNSSINCFIQYINNFMNYIFTLASQYIDQHIKKKVEEECANYIEQISSLKKNIFTKINDQIRSDHKIIQLETQINLLKNLLNDEKSRLQLQVNNLEERIEEMTSLELAQEKYDEMSIKIQEMQLFIKSLQSENRITKQTLEDNLCSLGHSLMTRTKESIEYQESVRSQFNLFRIKDQTLLNSLNDHPFLTAFIYNRMMYFYLHIFNNIKFNQSSHIDITDQYMTQRLKAFLKNIKEEDLFDKNVAEAFMEYILSVSQVQYEGFQEIEQIIRFILQIEDKPISVLFQRLFGIMGSQLPSQLAIKEVLQLNRDLVLMNYNDPEDIVIYDDEFDLLISAAISNQNVVNDVRNQFKNSQKYQKCQILSHLLQAISVQEELEKGDEIYNSLTVSSSESIQTFEMKLSYAKVKDLAYQLKLKPFSLFNYIIQTYERYSKERKKDQTAPKTQFQLNSNFIPKVMCDCFKNLSRFQLMYYLDMQNLYKQQQQQQQQQMRSPSTLIYADSILEEEEEQLQHLRKQDPEKEKQQSRRKTMENKKMLLNNIKKVKNTLILINRVSPQKNQNNTLKISVQPSQTQLDSSMSSKRSFNQQTTPRGNKK